MKPIFIVYFLFQLALINISKAQPDYPAASFLRFTDNAQTLGIADIGTVATEENSSSALTYNPALLVRNRAQLVTSISYIPLMRALVPGMYFANAGVYFSLDKKNSWGYNFSYLNEGDYIIRGKTVKLFNINQTLRYARAITDKISIGLGLNHLNRRLPVFFLRENNFAGDFGLNYRSFLQISAKSRLRINLGGALLNLGPKVSEWGLPPNFIQGYLPSTLQIGIMTGLIKTIEEDKMLSLHLAYQIQKYMFPTELAPQMSALNAIVHSFSSEPGGLNVKELVHQLGMEGAIDMGKTRITGRSGTFIEKSLYLGQSYVSTGLGITYSEFSFDFAYVFPLMKRNHLANTLCLTIAKRILIAKT